MTPDERLIRKRLIENAQMIKNSMTFEEKIKFLNTPYKDMPEELQPGMTKNPQKFKFVKMLRNRIGDQRETFGARLCRYRKTYHLTREQFCDIANSFGTLYGVKITKRDMINYEDFNVCPKIDKMTVITTVTDMPVDYFAGYGPNTRSKRPPNNAA